MEQSIEKLSSDSSPKKECLIVAIDFGSQSDQLIDAAIEICKRVSLSLRLITIRTPQPFAMWSGEIYGGLGAGDILKVSDAMLQAEAEAKLSELVKRVPKDLDVSSCVMTDDVSGGVISDSKTHSAKLILCGATKGKYWYVPKSMSNVLSLMSESPIPVLVMNEEAKWDFSKDVLKVLVMDDLSTSSADSIQNIFSFYSEFSDIDVIHAHVSGLTRDVLEVAVSSARAAARTGVVDDDGVEDIFETLEFKGMEKLRSRVEILLKKFENNKNKYEAKILYGNVQGALNKMISEFDPDIISFGKHHGIHRKPFGIGQVPYGTMLGQKKPILIVG